MTQKSAVYATCRDYLDRQFTVQVGRITDWNTAQSRWLRLDDRRRAGRRQTIIHNRRQYVPEFFEVRAVDEHGVGLGSIRHARALPVPYRAIRLAPR